VHKRVVITPRGWFKSEGKNRKRRKKLRKEYMKKKKKKKKDTD